MMKKKKIVALVIIIIAILASGGFLNYKNQQNKALGLELEYELSKPSQVSELPNNIPIFPGAVSHSYSTDSYNFIVMNNQSDVIKFYTDYFKNSEYKVAETTWCGGAQAMSCSFTGHTLIITDTQTGNEVVAMDVIPYKTGASFTLNFSQK